MRKIASLVACILLFAQFSFSQLGQWQWARGATGEEEGWAAATDKSGNVYATGYFCDTMVIGAITLNNFNDSYPFEPNIFIIKYSAAGNLLWARSAVIKDTGDVLSYGIATDNANNVFVTGEYAGDSVIFGNTVLQPTGYGDGFFIAKYDSLGNALWARGADGILNDQGMAIATDAGGNAYITGSFSSDSIRFGTYTLYNPAGTLIVPNTFIVKYSSTGQALWARSAGITPQSDAVGTAITTSRTGDIYAAGYYSAGASVFDSEGRLVYKTRIDSRLTEITFNAAPGIYLLKITGQQGEQTFKLVKE